LHNNEIALEHLMSLSFDLFWSFRSPYSYLATKRIVQIRKDYDVDVNVRPVYPIAVRIPGFFKQVNPLWPPYLFKDTVRIAEMEELDYAWPSPDPIVMDIASGDVPSEQPYIHRLTRLGALAAETGDGLAFIDEVSSTIWTGTKNWHEGNHLRAAADRSGFNIDEMDKEIEADPQRFETIIKANEDAQETGGHWGVPLMVHEGEAFFGQDRISHLMFRLEKNGLKKRG
jgi:2-hydroxychromene-2-carboxylate isomerase